MLELAEASGSRTHQRHRKMPSAGFEDRDDHRTACASEGILRETKTGITRPRVPGGFPSENHKRRSKQRLTIGDPVEERTHELPRSDRHIQRQSTALTRRDGWARESKSSRREIWVQICWQGPFSRFLFSSKIGQGPMVTLSCGCPMMGTMVPFKSQYCLKPWGTV